MFAYLELPVSLGVGSSSLAPMFSIMTSLYKINKSNKMTYNENERVILGVGSMGVMGGHHPHAKESMGTQAPQHSLCLRRQYKTLEQNIYICLAFSL